MAGLIVIQIVPESPVDAMVFRKYLDDLQIQVFDLSFATVGTNPPGGQSVGSASFIPDSGGWVQTPFQGWMLTVPPAYPAGITSGIIQQVDQVGIDYQLESVATAVIEVDSSAASGNYRVVVTQSGQTLSAIPYQYDRSLDQVATPDPATWSQPNSDGNILSSWAALSADFYVSVPASATTPLLQLPANGTPPAFDELLPVVKQMLASDPGTLAPIPIAGSAPAGSTTLTLTSVTGITAGMTATGTAIPPGTTVVAVGPGNTVTLSQELTGASGADVTFAVNLAALSFAQCQNIAYEIIWGQQGPLPSPPDPVEDLYTNPPNNGEMISGSTPNPYEGGRQQFEGQLQSYYAVADTNADRLTSFVYALSAAIANEQQSLAATQATLQFPVDPGTSAGTPGAGTSGTGTPSDVAVILTGVANAGVTGNFGVPAAYFYALAATMPAQITAAQRYQQATGDQLSRLLTDLTTAFNTGTITDSESCVTEPAVTISAAQAARRIAALGVPAGSATPQAPLGGAYTADLRALVASWLAFPPPPPATSGMASSAIYQPSDDDGTFWPGAATAHPAAFLNLVLAVVTQDYVIPAPFNVALGTQIMTFLAALPGAPSPLTVTWLASVTAEQWTGFFQQNPTWLPPFTQPGNTAARIAAFIGALQNLFPVGTSGPSSEIVLATTAATASGDTLPFASTTGIVQGMTVTGPGSAISAGTTVQAVTATGVQLSQDIAAAIPDQANITFTPSVTTSAGSGLPLLQAPPTDWLANCLSYYVAHFGAFAFGDGFDLANLRASAATVFGGDPVAQAWLVDALVAIDALYQVMKPVPVTTPGLGFSMVEALYARGFRAAADITELDTAHFQEALTGTVAYDSASAIYAAAVALAAPVPHTPGPGGFKPVNPDGALTDCIPAPCASPLGPVAYLHELLNVSDPSNQSSPTLGTVLSQRGRPVGALLATSANLETPLPLIDIVNEYLEYLGAPAAPPGGPVYHTSGHDLGALPEYSTPATPVAANAAVEPAVFDELRADFSSCLLPYSQALDVSRTYLRHLGSCRFEEMRTFRKCITEFVLDPTQEPAGFQDWLWRYPVRIDIAIEYLGITPEEYTMVFNGAAAPPTLRGTITLPAFLAETCLSYCEFYELWQSGFVEFRNGAGEPADANDPVDGNEPADANDLVAVNDPGGAFPRCEPCCLDDLWLLFPDGQQDQDVAKLLVFVRLWRKLRDSCCFCYSFAQLRDICDVLQLYIGGQLNPDFIRQLAAFQLLRDHFEMELADPAEPILPTAIDADRTQLLALWAVPTPAAWPWAVRQLIARVEGYARRRHACERRSAEFVKLLTANLDPLSRLAGFDPASATDSWHARPTHTLRFAEVLAKIYASDFSVGELIYLFTAGAHLDGDDPFPLQEPNDALDSPLELPDEEREHSLWRLRQELLSVQVAEDEDEYWSWRRIEAALHTEFGFAPADIAALGQHFFPGVLARSGYQVSPAAARFVTGPVAGTSAPMWNIPPDGPFQCDPSTLELSAHVPLPDRAVLAKLTQVHDLSAAEQQAVQDLFFQPRALLAGFALLFTDFATAQRRLIEEEDEAERFAYFRREFLLCHRRCRIIARHLSNHVAAATGQEAPEDDEAAALIVRTLAADENKAVTSWEDDSGAMPALTWTPPPNGSALAALLGLTGTGLIGEYSSMGENGPVGGAVVWRDGTGPLSAFGTERDRENCPVPTVLPSFGATLTPEQLQFASVHNGFLMKDSTGTWLGGAQGFTVTWSGALLVERDGTYEFWAGAPTPADDRPDADAAGHLQWRVELRRGQRSWVALSHHWTGEEELRSSALPLRRGAYELTAELIQPAPGFGDEEQLRPQHTGFQVKYSGPDTEARRTEIPHSRLFVVRKDQPLADGIADLSAGAAEYLNGLYVGSLRDIRRTYQRAFKALLFTHRFGLSARRQQHGTSELGYMLAQTAQFAGAGYYRTAGGFTQHLADFDFNFLPLLDDYHPPVGDARTDPSPQRIQAMFDWWERMFDYTAARAEVRRRCERELWHLFEEAQEKQPAHPGYLLRHIGADARHWELDLRYFQGQNVPAYPVTSTDLEDDRWTLRAWHADRWLRSMQCCFAAKDIAVARPDLWASDDPGAALPGETQTGNANLSAFLCDGCLENGEPRRYEDLKRLNDGLRERGRDALVAYLCHMNRVALPWAPGQFATSAGDLSDLLLLDVEAGLREKASRIEEAITAAQSFVRRARLGLEPGWMVGPAFARLWDREFATFHVWQACKRRRIYKENWVEWDALAEARGIEAFRFLDERLRDAQLTVAVPGGLDWWPDQRPREHDSLRVLQRAEASDLRQLAEPREGLSLLGTPQRDARPSWLAPLTPGDTELPYWLQTAIRLGTRFCRIDAAGAPPAGNAFVPHPRPGAEDCVTCCEECGCAHPPALDEYYFWLVDGTFYQPPATPTPTGFNPPPPVNPYQDGYQVDYYDPAQQEAALWQDPEQLPALLQWQGSLLVGLAWSRVHNGVFQQPRRSVFGVAITPGQDADLSFLGRTADSLTFSVNNGVTPDGYPDPPAPGFRYDLAADEAIVLPQLAATSAAPVFLGTLPAYPYFVFFAPGTHLFPLGPFAPSLAVARALRSHCRFEAALHWYRLAFDPLSQDCTWIDDCCCDSTAISCAQARDRAVLLHYLETLVEWGDALRRRGNAPEAFQQARVLFDTAKMILGKRPRAVRLRPPANPVTVTGFTSEFPPLNPRLLDIYDVVDDRLELIHADINARRLREGRPGREMPYFGNSPLREGWRSEEDACAEECDWCYLPSPYRFTFLIQKAQDYAAKAEQLGNALLAAFEKGDAEFLAALRAGQELELLALGLEAKKDQWRDADWQVEALQAGKSVSQNNLIYTNGLINAGPGGLIDGEIQYQNLTSSALSLRGTANVIEGVGEAMRLIPDLVLGAAGFGGSPVSIAWIPLGTKVGDALEAVARIINNSAEIDSMTAGLDQTNASWLRRLNEWIHQAQVLAIEIHQAERQILGAQRRRDQALTELNSHHRQMEQSQEVKDFLRDKFTAHDLYLFLQKETLALYHGTYDLALYAARQAQRAFNVERGHTTRRFIPDCAWDDLHEGLMAGERLSAALRHMEKAYLDENVREYELTKHLSLRLHFPLEFLRLRTTGQCEIEIPEWMFDVDAPGMYMRRIKSVSLTIPCVTGPYIGVHCRLTLIGSTTRIDPTLRPPAHECCCPPEPCCEECGDAERRAREYELCPDDPRAVRQYDARQAIATSSGQNDSGLFQLSFEDPRYLPFEYMGAVSRWRIELPPENNYFDFSTLTDTVITLNYTAREGGDLLRRAANASARRHTPGDGWHFFDVRHEFPDAWQFFRNHGNDEHAAKRMTFQLTRRMFPFIPGGHDLTIDKLAIVFGPAGGAPCGCPDTGECPCQPPCEPAVREIGFTGRHIDPCEEADVRCFAGQKWPGLYCGVFDVRLGPLDHEGRRAEFELRFPRDTGRLETMFLLCRYQVAAKDTGSLAQFCGTFP